MSKTVMSTEQVHVVFVDDGQGRRLLVAPRADDSGRKFALIERPLVLALTKEQALDAAKVIRQLAEELPWATTKPAPNKCRANGCSNGATHGANKYAVVCWQHAGDLPEVQS